MVRAMRLSIEAVDRDLEEAAHTLGASRFWSFATITLPLCIPGILAGAILAFAKAMGEFGATITFVSTSPARRKRCPRRSMPSFRCRGARRRRRGLS
jgi:molybdate transport system permease protein